MCRFQPANTARRGFFLDGRDSLSICFRRCRARRRQRFAGIGQPVPEGEKPGGNRRAIARIAASQQASGRQKKPGRLLPRSNNDKRRMVTRLQSNSRVP
ncbi:hypothetical protein EDD84_19740 [Burkholderia gladioli]|nr:hypothetical protein EDD84_19740 [Burkholderia gladioli]